jgi:hypothetical protein
MEILSVFSSFHLREKKVELAHIKKNQPIERIHDKIFLPLTERGRKGYKVMSTLGKDEVTVFGVQLRKKGFYYDTYIK